MKKSIKFGCLCMCLTMMLGSTPVYANNHKDTTLPTTFISYTQSTTTSNRDKTDTSSVYIKNQTATILNVKVLAVNDDNCTEGSAAYVKAGEWFIYNDVRETRNALFRKNDSSYRDYEKCHLKISTAYQGMAGTLHGVWSPDSVGWEYGNHAN